MNATNKLYRRQQLAAYLEKMLEDNDKQTVMHNDNHVLIAKVWPLPHKNSRKFICEDLEKRHLSLTQIAEASD